MTAHRPSNPEEQSSPPPVPGRGLGGRGYGRHRPVAGACGRKSGSRLPVLGTGAYTYEATHNWGTLPKHIHWGDTHGVVFDQQRRIYFTHQSAAKDPMDAMAVFDPGRQVHPFVRQGVPRRRPRTGDPQGGQRRVPLLVRHQESQRGQVVAGRPYRLEPRRAAGGRRLRAWCTYVPTNVAFAPDGGFYVGDGYGSSYIHQYDKDAKWVRTWGGAGSEPGKLRCPHGLWWDDRPGRTPALVVADRANSRLQYFTPDGKHISFTPGLPHPCYFSIRGDVLLVPDLHSRVSLLDRDNRPIVHLGYDEAWTQRVQREGLRDKPQAWEPGRFVHPHHASFDADGNIYVVEWVPIGRITRLRHVA